MHLCFVSSFLPPANLFKGSGDNMKHIIINIFIKLGFKISYILLYSKKFSKDEYKRYKILKKKIFYINKINIKYLLKNQIRKKLLKEIEKQKIKNFFFWNHTIKYIGIKKDYKICLYAMTNNKFSYDANLYNTKNFVYRCLKKLYFYFLYLKNIFNNFLSIKKANLYLHAGSYDALFWKLLIKKQPRVINYPHIGENSFKKVNFNTEYNFLSRTKKNCLLIGMPNTSLNSSNIKFFCEKILPLLKTKEILCNFIFYIVGDLRNKINHDLKKYLLTWKENLKFLGYVEDLNTLIYKSDAIIQVTPIKPVAASRIYQQASLGPLLILNSNIKPFYKELINHKNCLMGKTAEDFYKIFMILLNNKTKVLRIKSNLKFLYKTKWNIKKLISFYNEVFVDFYIKNKMKKKYPIEIS